jgi:lactobin A/cerein 7B family class IIb bacteriocin
MNLENLGVQEMNAKELKEVEGGFIEWLLGVCSGLALEIAFNPKNSEKQFMKGVNSYESMF